MRGAERRGATTCWHESRQAWSWRSEFCGCSDTREVVVYTSLDKEFSGPIFASLEDASTRVVPKYDAESTKTVGLTT